MTGSWVNVGELRIKAISAGAPIIQDAVVTGHDRDEVGLLIFPNIEAAAKVAGLDSDTSPDQVIAEIKVQKILCRGLAAYNRKNPASSTRIGRVLLLAEPPNVDANEITDKGYISQRAVLERRAGLVTRLYQGGPGVMVIQ